MFQTGLRLVQVHLGTEVLHGTVVQITCPMSSWPETIFRGQ